jgi:hypothetical protein
VSCLHRTPADAPHLPIQPQEPTEAGSEGKKERRAKARPYECKSGGKEGGTSQGPQGKSPPLKRGKKESGGRGEWRRRARCIVPLQRQGQRERKRDGPRPAPTSARAEGRYGDGFIAPWDRWLALQSWSNESANSGGTSRAPRASSAPSARPFVAEHVHRFAAAYGSEERRDHPNCRRGRGTAPEVPGLARR